jgi:hypothetical protein
LGNTSGAYMVFGRNVRAWGIGYRKVLKQNVMTVKNNMISEKI